MAESQTFYTSYAPAMDVLRHKGKSLLVLVLVLVLVLLLLLFP